MVMSYVVINVFSNRNLNSFIRKYYLGNKEEILQSSTEFRVMGELQLPM